MKGKAGLWLLVGGIPLALLLLAWQGGRYAALEARAKKLELSQEAWVEANRKLSGSIAVLESRERAAYLAKKLGLEPLGPDRRLLVVLPNRPEDQPLPASASPEGARNAPAGGAGSVAEGEFGG